MGNSLPDLIQQMLQPAFYPHPVDQPVKLLQTHISYVFLTGEYAYKVKKPANFGFLDFSTLERRRHFCHEELHLNRRLSPALYLQVLPIGRTAASQYQLESEDSGEVAEYALQMRQFDQDKLFSYLFDQGELSPERMQELGKRVASFHTSAETNYEIQAFGDVAAVRAVAEDNYQTSLPYIGRAQSQAQLEQTRAFSEQFFQDHADWFRQRQNQGQIRECHGDLHLNNVCLYEGQIQVFDCIEFNQEFRRIDVIYDAAFMVMDLELQGRPDLANAFLNAYLEQTGDYGGAVLLPLYLSMRAYIRAKVGSLMLDDPDIPEADRQQAQQRAAAYYRLAWEYTQRRQGRLILMSGLSGSGKTTIARQVARSLNAIHIRSDAVRKQLAGIPLEQRGGQEGEYGSGIYTPEMTQKTYDRLLALGVLLAEQGFPVILDAKYDRQALRQSAIAQAQTAQIPLQILHCTAPLEVLQERLQNRKGDIADATADLLTDQQQAAEPFTAAEQPHVHTLQTDQDLQKQLTPILD